MIQIGIACGSNCELYVDFLIDSIRKTIHPDLVELILGINRKNVDIDSLLGHNCDFKIKVVYAIEDLDVIPSSECHGRTLDVILSNMDAEHGMFVDCDCAFLEKNWNEKLLSCLNNHKAIVGSEYDGDKYMEFPNIVCCLFKTKILKDLGVSLFPKGMITIDAKNSLIFNRQIGDSIRLDVGWELCYKLRSNGYGGVAMPLIRTQHKDARFMSDKMRGEEYQLNGIPIVTHVGRSSSRNFLNDPIIIQWRTKVEEWLIRNG